MKRVLLVLLLFIAQSLFATDIIETRQNQEYKGKILKRADKGLVIRTVEGSAMVIPLENIARIWRGNKLLDFTTGQSYFVEKKHPYLPFSILGIACAAYSVNRFQEYSRIQKRADQESQQAGVTPGTQNTHSSSTPLAAGIVSGLLSAGSFYVALRPLEVRVPTGKISISAAPSGVNVSFRF
ncbi:hypothetical protein JW906_15640 [bacterium]|nr:hypothetical protein [bacterium]